MNRKTQLAAVAVSTAAAVAAGTGIALGSSGEEAETRITGAALGQASSAALAFTGKGRVTSTEVGDEESYYEVEVTLNDGSQVDVQLNRRFQVVTSAADEEGS